MKQSVPKSVDEYIAAQPETVRPKLEQVRSAIRRAVPEAVEGIGYRMPGYKLHGKPMLYFAGFREHYSLFAAAAQHHHVRVIDHDARGRAAQEAQRLGETHLAVETPEVWITV